MVDEMREMYAFLKAKIGPYHVGRIDGVTFLGAPLCQLAFAYHQLDEDFEVLGDVEYARQKFLLIVRNHDGSEPIEVDEKVIRKYEDDGVVPFHLVHKPYWLSHTEKRTYVGALGIEKAKIAEARQKAADVLKGLDIRAEEREMLTQLAWASLQDGFTEAQARAIIAKHKGKGGGESQVDPLQAALNDVLKTK